MTGNSLLFSELKECSVGYVTFGDGVKRQSYVIGKGSISRPELLVLLDVRLVMSLSANFISNIN